MTGKNKTPLLGWHPPAGLAEWIREYATTYDLSLSAALTEALESFAGRHDGAAITATRGQVVDAAAGAIVNASEGVIVRLPGGGVLTVGRRGDVILEA